MPAFVKFRGRFVVGFSALYILDLNIQVWAARHQRFKYMWIRTIAGGVIAGVEGGREKRDWLPVKVFSDFILWRLAFVVPVHFSR